MMEEERFEYVPRLKSLPGYGFVPDEQIHTETVFPTYSGTVGLENPFAAFKYVSPDFESTFQPEALKLPVPFEPEVYKEWHDAQPKFVGPLGDPDAGKLLYRDDGTSTMEWNREALLDQEFQRNKKSGRKPGLMIPFEPEVYKEWHDAQPKFVGPLGDPDAGKLLKRDDGTPTMPWFPGALEEHDRQREESFEIPDKPGFELPFTDYDLQIPFLTDYDVDESVLGDLTENTFGMPFSDLAGLIAVMVPLMIIQNLTKE